MSEEYNLEDEVIPARDQILVVSFPLTEAMRKDTSGIDS